MHQRMSIAACSGDVNTLHHLLQENPFILADYVLMNAHLNPLTTAIKANQPKFVSEILRLKPELVLELDQDGVRPLDLASAYGNVEIAKTILGAVYGPEICRLGGRDGRTAIHFAVANGRAEIIDLLMSTCPDSSKDVTSFGETTLHFAVKNFKCESLRTMLQWLEKTDHMVESVELLLDWNNTGENRLDMNALNKKGLTPVDIVDILMESSIDVQLREILRRAGGFASSDLFHFASETSNSGSNHSTNTRRSLVQKPKNWKDTLKHVRFQWERDSPEEAREALLVVAALVATITFQAGVTPPSYLFEASNGRNVTITGSYAISNLAANLKDEYWSGADTVVMVYITGFLLANSVAFSTAVSIIDYLTPGLPFRRQLRVAIFAMTSAYVWSVLNTRPTGIVKNFLLLLGIFMPLFLRFISTVRNRTKMHEEISSSPHLSP